MHDRDQEQYDKFIYESCTIEQQETTMTVSFVFSCGDITFRPKTVITKPAQGHWQSHDQQFLQFLGFHLGLAEIASYWKAFASPTIEIRAGFLTEKQKIFWRETLFFGMGEYFVVNNLDPFSPEILITHVEQSISIHQADFDTLRVLVPMGGGKDSAVSLELLSSARLPLTALIIGSDQAAYSIVDVYRARHGDLDSIAIERVLDDQLARLNERGFYNGHTPFSSVVATLSTVCGYLFGYQWIALSNERSANEPGMMYKGIPINHQYSKSFQFEQDFAAYCLTTFGSSVTYFSFLRPLYELQVGKIFSTMTDYHGSFRSCNVGQKTNTWCAACSKCLFVGLILSAFLPPERVSAIFGKDILNEQQLLDILESMLDESKGKPFECIGTREETRLALFLAYQQRKLLPNSPIPALIQPFVADFDAHEHDYRDRVHSLLADFDASHAVPPQIEGLLHDALATT